MINTIVLILSLFTSLIAVSQDSIIKQSPEEIVQEQVEGYNALNIDVFMAPYSDSLEIYEFPNTLLVKGKNNIKERYQRKFESTPNLHCEIVSRIVNGNIVIDQERITGLANGKIMEAIAIYVIEKGKIQKVYFPEAIIIDQE